MLTLSTLDAYKMQTHEGVSYLPKSNELHKGPRIRFIFYSSLFDFVIETDGPIHYRTNWYLSVKVNLSPNQIVF